MVAGHVRRCQYGSVWCGTVPRPPPRCRCVFGAAVEAAQVPLARRAVIVAPPAAEEAHSAVRRPDARSVKTMTFAPAPQEMNHPPRDTSMRKSARLGELASVFLK